MHIVERVVSPLGRRLGVEGQSWNGPGGWVYSQALPPRAGAGGLGGLLAPPGHARGLALIQRAATQPAPRSTGLGSGIGEG